MRTLSLFLALLLLAACGAQTTTPPPDANPTMTMAPTPSADVAASPTPPTIDNTDTAAAEQRYPDILDATLKPKGDDVFDVSVTVSSPYDTAERYADAWRILAPDGTVLGERVLLHDHANEQPFTRSLNDVRIPGDITMVTIQGRDKVYGYGGQELAVEVPR
ncbi:MAG: hypothetical protein MI924_36345 [Chloroflexales bacterium]|nr:hypothetical protein [Chloroflexales bacterium]